MQLHCLRQQELGPGFAEGGIAALAFHPHRRIPVKEILDSGAAGPDEVRQSLRDLQRINAFLGGRRLLLKILDEQLRRTGLKEFSLLDLGTGSGDLLAAVARWSRKRGYKARLAGLDRRISHLGFGRDSASPGWAAVCADALALPFPPHSFDFVSASLFLHHFDDRAAPDALRSFAQAARRALLVNDLERHALPYHFIRLAPFFAGSRVTRFDGPASIQQGFRKEELEALAQQAGFKRWRVRKHLPFRLSLVAELS